VQPQVSDVEWSIIILAGGKASRMGGQDKAAVTIHGTPALDRVLHDVPEGVEVIVVGPARTTSRPVVFCVEEPRFAGPVAALGAAVAHVRTPLVAVLGVDQPRAAQLASQLVREIPSSAAAGVIPVDTDGRRQPLGMILRVADLRLALQRLGAIEGRSFRELTAELHLAERVLSSQESALLRDFDTWADVRSMNASVGNEVAWDQGTGLGGPQANGVHVSLERWVNELRTELGIEDEIDIDAILDLARVAAHGVQRPAAPLTAYLLGIAVARGVDFGLAVSAIELSASTWVKSGDEPAS